MGYVKKSLLSCQPMFTQRARVTVAPLELKMKVGQLPTCYGKIQCLADFERHSWLQNV